MTIAIDPRLEARLREKAEAEGLSVEGYWCVWSAQIKAQRKNSSRLLLKV
jgi:hypothetical protein